MTVFEFFQNGEFPGVWWPPGQGEEQSVSGLLKYNSTEGIRLEAWRKLNTHDGLLLLTGESDTEPKILHGLLRVNREQSTAKTIPVTMTGLGANYTSTGSILYKQIYSNKAFFGQWFYPNSPIKIQTLNLDVRNLEYWLQTVPYEWGVTINSDRSFGGASAKIQRPDETIYKLPKGIELVFTHTWSSFPSIGSPQRKLVFSHTPLIKLRANKPVLYDILETVAFRVVYLLALLVGKPMNINSLYWHNLKGEPVSVLFRSNVTMEPVDIQLHDVMAPHPELAADFQKIVRRWMNTKYQESLVRVVALYTWALYGGDKQEHRNRFLDLCRAFESHQRDVRKVVLDRRQDNLKNRLTIAFSKLPKYLCSEITDDSDNFISIIGLSRNYHTHYDPAKKEKSLDSIQLYWAALKLQLLINILILQDLGLSNKYIYSTIKRNRHYRELKNRKP